MNDKINMIIGLPAAVLLVGAVPVTIVTLSSRAARIFHECETHKYFVTF